MKQRQRIPLLYKILYFITKFNIDFLYYRKTYYLNTKNIPSSDTPLIIVSNHQNSLNDAMAILYSMKIRRPHFMARADVFKNPFAAKFLSFAGVLPVYRQRDGMENVKQNLSVFSNIEAFISRGNTVVLYPEAMHQDRHFLGRFYLSYTRLAFGAAEDSNFEKEVFILPSANHYSDYFHMQEDMLQIYGKPISLKPYYELYKVQPREAQMKVNDMVRAQVESLMLNIEDEENYDAIYFLLKTYGKKFAYDKHGNPNILPLKLKTDQALVAILKKAYVQREDFVKNLYADAFHYKKELEELKVEDGMINRTIRISKLLSSSIVLILTFPIFIYGLLHHIIPYHAPKLINRKIKDKLLHPSVFIGLNALLLIPILYILYFVLCLVFTHSLLIAFIYLLTLPLSARLAWNYRKYFLRFLQKVRLYHYKRTMNPRFDRALFLRFGLYQSMDILVDEI
jgi:1-acyl-sn-glycerol-3-phosphate acyltransferase